MWRSQAPSPCIRVSKVESDDMKPTDSIRFLKGIGEKKEKRYEKLNIRTLEDLIFHFPVRYEDRSVFKNLNEIAHDEKVCSYGRIVNFEKSTPKRNMTIIKIVVKQGQSAAYLTFFNNKYIMDKYSVGDKIAFYGKAKLVFNRLEFNAPDIEFYGENKLTGNIFPVYPLTAGISNTEVQEAVKKALQGLTLQKLEILPEKILQKNQLAPLAMALKNIHFPEDLNKLRMARYRFVYEELLVLQLYILTMKEARDQQTAYQIVADERLSSLIQNLDYELTPAQQKVLEDIVADMDKVIPMQRLLQGDVGSGKTIVAFLAMYLTYLNGLQSAIMVPTEILAKQHYEAAIKLFAPYGINVRLLIGSSKKKEKEEIYEEIRQGTCHMVVGTHALIEDKVQFDKLGLAITDEQHRFGVKQRNALYSGYETTPHVLVLTATPIPRTLSLIIQGDLDVSLITQLPKGRIPIETLVVEQKLRHKAYEKGLAEVEKGKQVYIVCPLVEESEELDLHSAQKLYVDLKEGYYKEYRVGLIHGKMKAAEKNEIMAAFEKNEIQVLVSTTVIEVGINVPNATVMIIEEAQRFGLSQLHQLRGRVGRGKDQSYCILIYKGTSDIMKQRMQIMSETTDGFIIAEKDLILRGPGEVFGLRQHGLPEFKVADLAKHLEIMESAQKDARSIIEGRMLEQKERDQLLEIIREKFMKKLEEVALN